MSTTHDVAQWMFEEINRVGFLRLETAVTEIHDQFGAPFTYESEDGNLAISRPVLGMFRALTEDDFVWESESRQWVRGNPNTH